MSLVFQTLCVAFGMFSALPVPPVAWDAQNTRYILVALPLVGAVCGLVLAGWASLCRWLGFGGLLPAAGYCLAPVLVTGGFHLDGFADVCDARASHAGPTRRREILKDSHVGAFALIRVVCYFWAYGGLCTAFVPTWRRLWLLGLAYMLERAAAGLALACLPLAQSGGLAHQLAGAASQRKVRALLGILLAVLVAGLAALGGATGLLMALCVSGCFFYLRRVSQKEFGGLSGDLCGWFIQLCELTQWAALILGQALEAKGCSLWF